MLIISSFFVELVFFIRYLAPIMVVMVITAKIGTSLDSTGLFFPLTFNVRLVLVANLSFGS